MQIRPAIRSDLESFAEIDGIVESSSYLHLDRTGEGLAISLKIEARPLREKLMHANRLGDEALFAYRQITQGIDEGIALVAEHENLIVACAVGLLRPETSTLYIADLRVDYDFRRQGLATAMLYQITAEARARQTRAVHAEIAANNLPANQMLQKCGFELSGIDWRRQSNHDLIKECATVLWYLPLD
jgi:ribosomal protein S18 acetylase RimI-like enzyme